MMPIHNDETASMLGKYCDPGAQYRSSACMDDRAAALHSEDRDD